MCTLSIVLCIFSFLNACFRRILFGKPSKVLKYGTKGFSIPGFYYPAMMLFSEPFLDEEKLREILEEMAAESGIKNAKKRVRLTFEKEVPSDSFNETGFFEPDYYVEKGTNWNAQHFLKHKPAPVTTFGMGVMRGHIIW